MFSETVVSFVYLMPIIHRILGMDRLLSRIREKKHQHLLIMLVTIRENLFLEQACDLISVGSSHSKKIWTTFISNLN